jgi:hypothetical protein
VGTGDYDSPNAWGFLYNGSTYSSIADPLGWRTEANGISGSNIVGTYYDASGNLHGFLFNGSTYTTLDDPLGVKGTQAWGISGTDIVGNYYDSSGESHGFLYNGSTYTTLDTLLGNGTQVYAVFGIDGNNIVGCYSDSSGDHGFAAAVPEPSAFALVAVGAIGLLGHARGRRRRNG